MFKSQFGSDIILDPDLYNFVDLNPDIINPDPHHWLQTIFCMKY